jgi:hypothetical protein
VRTTAAPLLPVRAGADRSIGPMKVKSASDVFLLGAGFSRAISPSMPLLQGLAERVLGRGANRRLVPPEVLATMKRRGGQVPAAHSTGLTALLTQETMRALWFAAGDALKRARRIISMGYSLPESDLTMKHFLRTTCARGAEIVVVDPSAAAHQNFQRLFAGTGLRIVSHTGTRGSIDRFVQQHLADRADALT